MSGCIALCLDFWRKSSGFTQKDCLDGLGTKGSKNSISITGDTAAVGFSGMRSLKNGSSSDWHCYWYGRVSTSTVQHRGVKKSPPEKHAPPESFWGARSFYEAYKLRPPKKDFFTCCKTVHSPPPFYERPLIA